MIALEKGLHFVPLFAEYVFFSDTKDIQEDYWREMAEKAEKMSGGALAMYLNKTAVDFYHTLSGLVELPYYSQGLRAFKEGENVICVSATLRDHMTPEAFEAILWHEKAHIGYGDTFFSARNPASVTPELDLHRELRADAFAASKTSPAAMYAAICQVCKVVGGVDVEQCPERVAATIHARLTALKAKM